jgi:type II secretory pathway pseudopilin PulG
VSQRGTTLVELVIAVAIAVVFGVAVSSLAQGSRTYAKQSAVHQFDAAFAYAQSLAASSGNGSTMVFNTGTLVVYSGRPTTATAMSASSIAPIALHADISEAVLGAPPFSVFINGAGHASASNGMVAPGTVIAGEPGCPPGEQSVTITFSDPQGSVTRSIPCNAPIAGAPATIGSVPK